MTGLLVEIRSEHLAVLLELEATPATK